jgi:hypothetical protein
MRNTRVIEHPTGNHGAAGETAAERDRSIALVRTAIRRA